MDSKKLIGGLLAGAAIGVAIGMLLAPSSGKETRTKLAKGSRKLADGLQGTVDESVELLKEKFNSSIDGVVRKGRELIGYGTDGNNAKNS